MDCSNSITSETIHQVEDILALRKEWNSLLKHSEQNCVFLSWEWHYTWWQCFARPSDVLQIILIKSNGQLVGLAPLYLQGSKLGNKTLRFVGTGEAEADEIVTEYLDFIALPEFKQAVVDEVYEQLLNQNDWRKLEFNNVLDSYLCMQVAKRLESSFAFNSHLNGRTYTTPLENSETQYREVRLPPSRNKRLKRCLKAIDKDAGGLTRKETTTESDIDLHLDILRKLHDERWSSKKKGSIFESKSFLAFHRQLLTLLVPLNKASITLYSLNDQPLAALYVMFSKHDCHYYQSGFSKLGENRYMPLFVSHIKEMNAARERGLSNYDFMRGTTSSYKSDFGCTGVDMFDTEIYRSTIEFKLTQSIRGIRKTCHEITLKTSTLFKSKQNA